MTNGQNNPNDMPDEEWAMSEPEIPVKKEIQAKPIDEQAASLYAPPETGDLEEWDIATEDESSQDESSFDGAITLPPPTSPPQGFTEPTAFTPPPQSFEVLKPIAPPKFKGEDWEMEKANSKNDGWKMPEPTFRATEGEILTKIRRSSSKSEPAESVESAQVQENLPDIYAPPDTEEVFESITEDFDSPETQEEISEEMDFSNAVQAENNISQETPAQAADPAKNKKWSFLIWGLLLGGLLVIVLLAVGVGFYFYSAKQ
jgi:hypothetical protein